MPANNDTSDDQHLEERAAADVATTSDSPFPLRHDGALFAELRAEYEAFRTSTAELLADLRTEVEERDETIQKLRGELRDDAAVRRLSTSGAHGHLQRAEEALERERAEGASLRLQLHALRAQLERAEAETEVMRAAEAALRVELTRLRASCAESIASEEKERNAKFAAELEDAERRCAASASLADRLAADNAALTELLNTQAALLDAVRRAWNGEAAEVAQSVDGGSYGDDDARTPEIEAGNEMSQPATRRKQPSRSLLGVLWGYVAGYDDAPQGQVLLE